MTHITLEEIEKKIKNKPHKTIWEIKVISIIFIFAFLTTFLFTNAQLIIQEINSIFNETEIVNREQDSWKENNKIIWFLRKDKVNEDNTKIMLEINESKNNHWASNKEEENIVEKNLEEKIWEYQFDFNLLPPNNRLIIENISVDVPLIQSSIKNEEDLKKENFDKELSSGVVQYPSTPEPWTYWNTLIYGHSSQERWKKNKYGTVFSWLPKLTTWDIIQIIREGKLYKYKVIDKKITYPKNVPDYYNLYQWKADDFITLMGCYPIGKDTKRILITAQRY